MKVKGEPGDYLPFEDVKNKLKSEAYGAMDLVNLGLFHSEHFVRDAIRTGKLKSNKINSRIIVLCRDDILDYWRLHRYSPYEPVNNTLTLKLTISEADYIAALVQHGQKRVCREFSKDDLFRNIINEMKETNPTINNQPRLFVKRF